MTASRTSMIGAMALTCLLAHFVAPQARAGFYDASGDFSATANPNGVWSYGWSQSLGSAFISDAIHQNNAGLDFWEGGVPAGSAPGAFPTILHNGTVSTITYKGSVLMTPGQLALHPGPGGEYSVLRFTTMEAGTYSLNSAFMGVDFAGPTSTDVHISLNGLSIFDGLINDAGAGSILSFGTALKLRAGDTLDFEVGYGIDKRFFNDSTGLSVVLSTTVVPEPASLCLVGIGLVGLIAFGSRSGRIAGTRGGFPT